MSHNRRSGESPGRALIELAKRQSELAIDLSLLLAGATGRAWADGLVDRARILSRSIEEAGVDVQLGRRELGPAGPEMPILAAIEKRDGKPAFHEPAPPGPPPPAVPPGGDWRALPIEDVPGIMPRFIKLCGDSGIETAGEAWDQLESGTLSPSFWTRREARWMEALVAQVRLDAGDPDPCLEATGPETHPSPANGSPRRKRTPPRAYDGRPEPEGKLPDVSSDPIAPAPVAPSGPIREAVIVGGRAGAEAPRDGEGSDGRTRYVALNPFKKVRYVARAFSLDAARIAIGRLDIAGALEVVEDFAGVGSDQALKEVLVTEEDERQARTHPTPANGSPLTPEELDDFATEDEFAAAVELADLDAPGGPEWRPDSPGLSNWPAGGRRDGKSLGLDLAELYDGMDPMALNPDKGQSRARRLVRIEGKTYVATGGMLAPASQHRAEIDLAPAVPIGEWLTSFEAKFGPPAESVRVTPEAGYRGLIVHHGGERFVIGPKSSNIRVEFDESLQDARARKAEEGPKKYIDVCNLPKPKRKRKSERSFDVVQKIGDWVARIWAEDVGTAWALAGTAFDDFHKNPQSYDVKPASARYSQDVVNCGGKRLRDIAWESGGEKGRERFHMASPDDVGIPKGAPVPDGKTLEEQGYAPGIGSTFVGPPVLTFEVVEDLAQPRPGHIRFGCTSLVEARKHAEANWPGMFVREVRTPTPAPSNGRAAR